MAALRAILRIGLGGLWLRETGGAGDDSCWFGGVTRESCCAEHFGPEGNPGCWDLAYTFERCCGPPEPKPAAPIDWEALPQDYPECVQTGIVLRHAGEHAVFADMSSHGHKGCFQNDCTSTDKFDADDPGICARLCGQLDECTHWTFGKQDGSTKCFLRKSDAGREQLLGWSAGAKACVPARLPHGFAALKVADSPGVKACDEGKNEDTCPDTLAAINTWIYAIDHLKKAAEGRVDAATMQHVNQIGIDSRNLVVSMTGEYRPSDLDFPRVVFNNRLIFDNLKSWLQQFPTVELREEDLSLPNPLRTGKLCGKRSCYEK